MDIAILISHNPDNRYKKRLKLFSSEYKTGIVYWNKKESPQNFTMDNVEAYEFNVKANRTNPLKRIPQTIKFIKLANTKLEELSPRCLYVGKLDMLYIAVRYKKRHKNVKIIYEIADLHRLIIDKQKSIVKRLISKLLRITEKKFCKQIDRLVLTSMKFYEVYYNQFLKKDNVIFMPNMPEPEVMKGFTKNMHDDFTVGFIGWIRYKDQLRMLIRAAEKANVKVLFAGEDEEGNEFEEECKKYSHVTYLGPFDHEKELKTLYGKVDCVYAVYDADMANVRVALPNKMYESILCGLPIIVAKKTYLSEQVLKMGVGIAVGHEDELDLRNVLTRLSKDDSYYRLLCDNCEKHRDDVDLHKYNRVLLSEIDKLVRK